MFGAFTFWSFAPGNRDLAHQIAEFHELLGWIIIGVASLHAAAALMHRFLIKDRVFQRMTLRA